MSNQAVNIIDNFFSNNVSSEMMQKTMQTSMQETMKQDIVSQQAEVIKYLYQRCEMFGITWNKKEDVVCEKNLKDFIKLFYALNDFGIIKFLSRFNVIKFATKISNIVLILKKSK